MMSRTLTLSRFFTYLLFCALIGGLWTFAYASKDHENSRPSFSNNKDNFTGIHVSKTAKEKPLNTSIFVWVMTAPKYYDTRAKAVNTTWLNHLKHGEIFTSSKMNDENVPYRTVFRDFDDSYEKIFYKAKFGFYYAYTQISQNFDWYIRADDNTYVIAENLEKYVEHLDPNKPHYAGFTWTHELPKGHNSGSFYMLSRAAMKIFAEELYHDEEKCPFNQIEDVGIAKCLANANIFPDHTRDAEGRDRFIPFSPSSMFDYNGRNFTRYSPDLVSVHYMEPDDMINADLFLYHIPHQNMTV